MTGNGIARSGLRFQQISLAMSLVAGALGVIGIVIAARAAELSSNAARATGDAICGSPTVLTMWTALDGRAPETRLLLANIGSTPAIVDSLASRQAGTTSAARGSRPVATSSALSGDCPVRAKRSIATS